KFGHPSRLASLRCRYLEPRGRAMLALFGMPAQGGAAMPQAATTEFWRDIKPINPVFKPHALPEAYIKSAVTEDERYYLPITATVWTRPLFISTSHNRWCDILFAKGAGMVNRHYHPHGVFAYTISGKWGYLEHDWVATAGDFVYETPGE